MNNDRRNKLPQLRALELAVHAAFGLSAWALPQGATVANGQVSMTQPAANALQIKASNGAIINWKQFSIGAGETTQFVQPTSSSAVLNRVVGAEISSLLGQLKANPGGSIALIAPDIENTGIIQAPDGNILLAAGRRLEISSMDLEGVTFEIQAPLDSVLNLGFMWTSRGKSSRASLG